jgi:diguanylate cyclase (GGDEF)-like protein
MERSLAAIFAAAAGITWASLVVPHWARVSDLTIAVAAGMGFLAAAVLWSSRGRVPIWVLHVLMVIGTTLIGVGVYMAGAGVGSATVAFLYVFVALYTGHFFKPGVAAAHIAYAILSYAVFLGLVHERTAASEWLFVASIVVATGIAVGRLSAEVRALALRDSLTGLGNRRAWEEALPRQMALAARNQRPLCVALIDVDGFKGLNDRDGHLAGDRVLAETATAWAREVRASDLLARYGGDEFALIFPDCEPVQAAQVLARLGAAAPAHAFSVGLAPLQGDRSPDELVGDADAALYGAKRTGRARVVAGETTLDLRDPSPDRLWHRVEVPR